MGEGLKKGGCLGTGSDYSPFNVETAVHRANALTFPICKGQ
jgi:hypothetical protein